MSRGGVGRAGGGGGRGGVGRGLADRSGWGGVSVVPALPLPQVDLGMPFALITAGKLASAFTAGKRLLASVRADVCGQVVAATEATHADAALKRFLASMHSHVACQLIGAREAAVTALGRAGVWTLMGRRLALSACYGFPGPARFGQVSWVGGARDGALRLCLNLGGEGFDGGEWCKRRCRWVQAWFLVLVMSQLTILRLL